MLGKICEPNLTWKHIFFRMGYIEEFKVHQPVYDIQYIYLTFYPQPTTPKYIYLTFYHLKLPSFGPGKGCPEPIFPDIEILWGRLCSSVFWLFVLRPLVTGRNVDEKRMINVFCLNEKPTEKSFKKKTCNLNIVTTFLRAKLTDKGLKENLKKFNNQVIQQVRFDLFLSFVCIENLTQWTQWSKFQLYQSQHGADSQFFLGNWQFHHWRKSILTPSILGVESFVYHSKHPHWFNKRTHHEIHELYSIHTSYTYISY